MEREPVEKHQSKRQKERDAKLPLDSRIRRTLAEFDEKDPSKHTLKYKSYRAVAQAVFADELRKLKKDQRERALDIYEGQVWFIARKAQTDTAHPGHRTDSDNALMIRDKIAIRNMYRREPTREELMGMFTRPIPDSYQPDNVSTANTNESYDLRVILGDSPETEHFESDRSSSINRDFDHIQNPTLDSRAD